MGLEISYRETEIEWIWMKKEVLLRAGQNRGFYAYGLVGG